MSFNPYVWQLYQASREGEEAIATFSSLLARLKAGAFALKVGRISYDFGAPEWAGLVEDVEMFMAWASNSHLDTLADASSFFADLVRDGLTVPFISEDGQEEIITLKDGELLGNVLIELSTSLYLSHPEFFVPYFFVWQFDLYRRISEAFGIPVPDVPKKGDVDGRVFYYFELCQSLYEFRQTYSLSPAELCAFLYDFAPHFIASETDAGLPSPLRVWIVGAGTNDNGDAEFLDNADQQTTTRWQGNVDTRRGDIVLMYCVSPRSCIHSIWRAKADGFVDPFFYFYSTVWIGEPIKTVPVTFSDLRSDPLLARNGLVRGSMQGINGRVFTLREYEAILAIMEGKGQDLSLLPQIERLVPDGEEAFTLEDERDVEIHLVEPLLTRLGYETDDWTRQMTLRMGSGERIYPDYAFFARTTRGEEEAQMILETKYRIRTSRELFKAYCQAKSYALRLQARIFVLAAIEGIWMYTSSRGGFQSESFTHHTWPEMYHPDVFPSTLASIGKQALRDRQR